ncbi:MAG: hypothetical protein JST49_11210 [Bacteroidetes bacterium]|nr:hypothetical protein [Bacteroidota bacterium]
MYVLKTMGLFLLQVFTSTILIAIVSTLVVIVDDRWGDSSQRLLAPLYGIYIQVRLLPLYGFIASIFAIAYKDLPYKAKNYGIFLPSLSFCFVGLPIVYIWFEWLGFVMLISVLSHFISSTILIGVWNKRMGLTNKQP